MKYHPEDEKWILRTISRLTAPQKATLLLKYEDAYEQAYNAEQVPYKKHGTARRVANTKLRVFLSKLG
mgnify:CR=1 FL=1